MTHIKTGAGSRRRIDRGEVRMKVSRLAIVLVVIAAALAYFGFPSPDTLLSMPTAKEQCVKFASDNKAKLFFGKDNSEIKAVEMWMKNGRLVVEVGAFETGDTSYSPRLCVLGGGHIEIVSMLENAAWR